MFRLEIKVSITTSPIRYDSIMKLAIKKRSEKKEDRIKTNEINLNKKQEQVMQYGRPR